MLHVHLGVKMFLILSTEIKAISQSASFTRVGSHMSVAIGSIFCDKCYCSYMSRGFQQKKRDPQDSTKSKYVRCSCYILLDVSHFHSYAKDIKEWVWQYANRRGYLTSYGIDNNSGMMGTRTHCKVRLRRVADPTNK